MAAADIEKASLKVGPTRRRLRSRTVRRAARAGVLRVRISRKTMRRRWGTDRARARRAQLVLTMRSRAPAAPVRGRLGTFEAANFDEFNGSSVVSGELDITTSSSYEGTHSARAGYDGSGQNGFARTWFEVDWRRGSDVWYGAAYFIPTTAAMPCWYSLLRWDNYKLYGNPGGDVGGIEVSTSGRARLMRQDYTGRNHALLSAEFALPRGRWFWLEVHQRLSDRDGEAVNEVFLDGRPIRGSRRANSRGRRVTEIRHGLVALAGECARATSILIDRVSVSDGMRGPLR